MRTNPSSVLFLIVLLSASSSFSQRVDESVNLSMFVDERPISTHKIKVEIVTKEGRSRVAVKNGSFSTEQFAWLPPDTQDIDLRIYYNRYHLEFRNLTKEHLIGSWRVYIENPPFKFPDEVHDVRRADYVYRIEFNSGGALGTVLRRTRYKN